MGTSKVSHLMKKFHKEKSCWYMKSQIKNTIKKIQYIYFMYYAQKYLDF